jgi:hypothetical protein
MRQNSNDRSVIPIARGAGNSEILWYLFAQSKLWSGYVLVLWIITPPQSCIYGPWRLTRECPSGFPTSCLEGHYSPESFANHMSIQGSIPKQALSLLWLSALLNKSILGGPLLSLMTVEAGLACGAAYPLVVSFRPESQYPHRQVG